MSNWSYINGVISVCLLGETNAENEFVLKTVLSHCPLISGSEKNAEFFINRLSGNDMSSPVDEFDCKTELCQQQGNYEVQSQYIVSVTGSLRDRTFEETIRETVKFLNRFSKRILVIDVVVKIDDTFHDKSFIISNKNNVFTSLYEDIQDNWSSAFYLDYNKIKEYMKNKYKKT